MQVEKEVQEIRERLAKVDEMKKRREEIDQELAAVWTEQGESLEAPSFIDKEEEKQQPEAVEGSA